MDDIGLLRLQIEWGADEALDDLPLDRLLPLARLPVRSAEPAQAGRAATQPLAAPAPQPLAAPAPITPQGAALAGPPPAEQALAVALRADTLDALRQAIAGFDGCGLRDTATNLVFAAGPPDATCLVVGDPPNADDDRSGQPFSGADGALLDRMLASAGLDRARLLLAPLVPWRPPGGRPASASEVAICLPFLHRLIALTVPDVLVIAGAHAVRALIGTRPRAQAGARVTECAIPGLSRPVPAILLPFPATVLRSGAARREAWAALRRLRRMLDG